ncbi:hypothetical protein KJZ61_01000 [Candidatus Dependentiae bacterium]|nr:hypothetical protein [Candidatus Dependentiae bacterium]
MAEIANFPCPQCGNKTITKGTWQGNTVWQCTPHSQKCTYTIFGDIEELPCPLCKSPYLLKRFDHNGSVELHCNTKDCGYMHQRAHR